MKPSSSALSIMWNSKNIPYLITITKGACGDKFCCVDKFRHLDKFCHVEKVCHVQLREGQFPAFHVSPVVVLLALHCKKNSTFMLFCRKIYFVGIYALLCEKNLETNLTSGEKWQTWGMLCTWVTQLSKKDPTFVWCTFSLLVSIDLQL